MAFVQSLSTNVFVLVFGLVLLNCFSVDKLGSHAQVTQLLPEDEVQILKTVSSKLHNNNWTIDRTSCGSAQWNRTLLGIQSNVTCDCTFVSGTVCHVISFKLKGFNLTGVLPSEFRNLTHLREIDLTRNYLNGSIPASLAELPNLQTLSLIANRLTGSIPREFGSIATLESLTLEDNLLGGSLHPDLGNLRSLKKLLLSANNFTGTIPDTFGNLKNITDFRIDGSELSGKIPSFIGNWTNIERLDFQGTSMEGPIPPNISLLKKLEELRISDLNGSGSTFPDLQDMNNLTVLILRNCSMTGTIPGSIGDIASLNTLGCGSNLNTISEIALFRLRRPGCRNSVAFEFRVIPLQHKHLGAQVSPFLTLPRITDNGIVQDEPLAILERKIIKHDSTVGVDVLVHWKSHTLEDAMWEDYNDLKA